MAHLPIENCYWVGQDRLLAGEYPRTREEASSRARIEALLCAGITTFIDLTGEGDGLLPYAGLLGAGQASYQRFPIRDISVPHSRDVTTNILDAIDRRLDQGGRVYVHCWGGVGRTGVIVGCWLARHGFRREAALERLRELWRQCPKSRRKPRCPETDEQEGYILGWEESR